MTDAFNFEEALKLIQSWRYFTGKNRVLATLIKQLTKATSDGGIESHIAMNIATYRRNIVNASPDFSRRVH